MASPPTIRIFRPGTFTDIHGTVVSFAAADLADIVSSYDAVSDPAPLVIGHPKTDDPAWGWVGALALDGETIVATPSDVAPEFAEAVRSKRYRKVSASFYPPAHPANPKPGRWYLKHVGFLGAAPPAVKGLGTVAFSEDDEASAFTLPFTQEHSMNPDKETAFAEREAALITREQSIADKETAFAERERQAAERAKTARHNDNLAFAERLIDDGKLAPAGKDKLVGVMDQLDAEATVSFGEGDANQLTPLAALRSLFDGAQPVIALGEHAPADKKPQGERSADEIAREAVEFTEVEAKAGRTVSAQAAVRHVMARADK